MSESGLFPVTQWTQVSEAREVDSPSALEAMDSLARAYWQPLYVLARQKGLDHEGAADAVQGFLSRLLTREGMRRVERRETRFRSFLSKAFSNWLLNERRRRNTVKRGGGTPTIPLNEFESLRNQPIDESDTPEEAFDRRWARALYDQAMIRLCAERTDPAREDYSAMLREIAFGRKPDSLDAIARRFQTSAGALRRAASALRAHFGKLLRLEVERAVSDPAEAESEMRYLLNLLTNH